MKNKVKSMAARKLRNRRRLNRKNPRISIFRSERHIYAQVIDDENSKTLASASSLAFKSEKGIVAAEKVGKIIYDQIKEKKIDKMKFSFDRGSYRYHGRIKALADSIRSAGLKF